MKAFRPSSLTLAALTLVGGGLLASCAGMSGAPMDAPAAIARAQEAMGGTTLKTLKYSGSGTGGIFGQAYRTDLPWPRTTVSMLSRDMDFDNASMRQDMAITRAEPNGGGALPLIGTGEQRSVAMVQGDWAWNMVGPAPAAAPVALEGRVHDLWTSPHGVLKAALKNKVTAASRTVDGKTYTTLTFTEAGKFEATAYINADNMVERVDSRQPGTVMGDTDSVISYSGYKNYAGTKFPTRIHQTMGGSLVMDINVTDVQPLGSIPVAVPDLVRQFKENVVSTAAGAGVWFLAGGSHNSVLIEMKDYTVLVETPLYDGRSLAVIAEARRLVPGKPLRYAINSHHHFDHAGGLRTAAAEGITLITSANAKPWYDRALANPNRIKPDALAKSGKSATVEGVNGKRVLTDGERTIEISEITDSVHAQGFLMVYLPKEKLLIEADAFTPSAAGAPAPAVPNGNNLNLVKNIEQNKLAVERILPLHGRMVTMADLMTAVGRK